MGAFEPIYKDCDKTEPFIKLDPLGTAPVINYNLPTENWFRSKTYIALDISNACFKSSESTPPANNFWDAVENMSATQIAELINDDIAGYSDKPAFVNSNLLQNMPIVHKIPRPVSATDKGNTAANLDAIKQLKGARIQAPNQPMDLENPSDTYISGLPATEIIKQISKGRRPMLTLNFAGLSQIKFISRPVTPRPRIAVALNIKRCFFLQTMVWVKW